MNNPTRTTTADPAAVQLAARLEVFAVYGVGLLTAVAMFFSGWGMWHTISDKFPQIAENPALIVPVFLIFDMAGVLCAVISVVCLLRHQVRGIAYPGVWAFAGLSGFMSATDAHNWTERAIRFLVPIVAAIFFEILLALKRKHLTNKASWTDKILQPLRVLFGGDRTDDEVRRGRAARRLALQSYAMHQIPAGKKRGRAERAFLRALGVAIDKFAVATDAKLIEEIRVNLAAMHGAIAGTSAAAVSDASPWTLAGIPAPVASAIPAPVPPVPTRQLPPVPAPVPSRELVPTVPVPVPAASNGNGKAKGTKADMVRLLEQNPDLTKADLARQLGVDEKTIYNWRRP